MNATTTVASTAWLIAALAATSTASAQPQQSPTPAQIAARRALIQQANAEAEAGHHVEALNLGNRAGQILMSPSLRLFLAGEQVALGHFADALGSAELCIHQARTDASTPNRDQVMHQCQDVLDRNAGRVGHVTVHIPATRPPGLIVRIADQALDPAFWDTPYTVNPGPVAIDATADGFHAFHQEVQVAAGTSAELTLALEALPPDQLPQTNPDAGAPVTAPDAGIELPPPPPHPRPLPVGSFVVMGVGAVSLGFSAITGLVLRAQPLAQLERDCPNPMACPGTMTNRDHFAAVQTWTIVTDVAIGVGAAALLGGAVWLVVDRVQARSEVNRRVTVDVTPLPGGGGAMFSVGGAL